MELKTNEGPSFEEIAIIEKATGGKIATHEWWVVKGVNENFTSNRKPYHEQDIIYHGVLENSFMSQGGVYIGDFKRAKWYYETRLKVYEPYAHGVAEFLDENGNIEGYAGYTHRGGNIFKIGDRLFDDAYEPKEEDYPQEQWQEWVKEYENGIAESEAKGDTWWANDIKQDGISRFIPYRLRGPKVIENLEEAVQAAINLSKYLS